MRWSSSSRAAAISATMLAATSWPGTLVCCALAASTAAVAMCSALRTLRAVSHFVRRTRPRARIAAGVWYPVSRTTAPRLVE